MCGLTANLFNLSCLLVCEVLKMFLLLHITHNHHITITISPSPYHHHPSITITIPTTDLLQCSHKQLCV